MRHKLGADKQTTQIHGPGGPRDADVGLILGPDESAHLIKGWHPFAPVRRTHTLHPSPFLIDQDGSITSNAIPKLSRQTPELFRGIAVTLKEDETPRPRLTEEGGLLRGKEWPRGRKNVRARCQVIDG